MEKIIIMYMTMSHLFCLYLFSYILCLTRLHFNKSNYGNEIHRKMHTWVYLEHFQIFILQSFNAITCLFSIHALYIQNIVIRGAGAISQQ